MCLKCINYTGKTLNIIAINVLQLFNKAGGKYDRHLQ